MNTGTTRSTLKFRHLTELQKKYICNGCGGKGSIINPPEFLFHASCDVHDFKSWLGCTEEDRVIINNEFRELMTLDIEEELKDKSPFKKKALKQYYRFWCFSYFQAVKYFSKPYFYYGARQKTLSDLIEEMG